MNVIKWYEKTIEINNKNYRKLKDLNKAKKLFVEAIKINVQNYEANRGFAQYLFELNEYQN